MEPIENRVRDYWTKRAHDFNTVRKNELEDPIRDRWLEEMEPYFPASGPLDVLDVGCGTGYFAILLSQRGHRVTGIDLTEAMLREAEATAAQYGVSPRFLLGDAQDTGLPAGGFDLVVTRNLTWTLPEPDKACREWSRLLKKGGVLLNFDADYARNVRNQNQAASYVGLQGVYGHVGVTPELSRENAEITLAMPASRRLRPAWDLELLAAAGFSACGADEEAGRRVLQERDLSDAPLFLVWGRK